ncbi:MAG: hypothetical protein RAP70_05595 [Candidatus Celaenobacter antarcticus]|nr:hypothetical protein [Candidatus Celaenobacter antarcticus]MDP8314533.1 hypothetical protein [Candidatus Celaenobacter antarcticus]
MKKKTLTLIGVIIIMLIGNTIAYAMTGAELLTLCDPADAEIITQYLDLSVDYPVIREFALQSGDEVIYEAVVVGPNGEKYIIIVVNGVVHLMKA